MYGLQRGHQGRHDDAVRQQRARLPRLQPGRCTLRQPDEESLTNTMNTTPIISQSKFWKIALLYGAVHFLVMTYSAFVIEQTDCQFTVPAFFMALPVMLSILTLRRFGAGIIAFKTSANNIAATSGGCGISRSNSALAYSVCSDRTGRASPPSCESSPPSRARPAAR